MCVQCLGQGHNNSRGCSRIGTANLPVIGRPAPPPERQSHFPLRTFNTDSSKSSPLMHLSLFKFYNHMRYNHPIAFISIHIPCIHASMLYILLPPAHLQTLQGPTGAYKAVMGPTHAYTYTYIFICMYIYLQGYCR